MSRFLGLFCLAILMGLVARGFANADTISDSYGQKVEADADAAVTQARDLWRKSKDDSDLDKSIAMLRDVVKKHPEHYRAWYNYAIALYRKADEITKEVEGAYDTAIAIRDKFNIQDGSIFNSAGWTYLNERKYDKAEKLLIRGLSFEGINRESTNSLLFYNLGRLYFEIGDAAKAKTFLSKAVEKKNPLAKQLLDIVTKAPKQKS